MTRLQNIAESFIKENPVMSSHEIFVQAATWMNDEAAKVCELAHSTCDPSELAMRIRELLEQKVKCDAV